MSNYYIAPSDETFEEIKRTAISIWSNPNYGYHQRYISEKVNSINGIKNIRDNYAYIIAKFDDEKQVTLIGLLSDEARNELFPRDLKSRRGSDFERLRPRSLW
jgi:hypothetical protein